MIMRGNFALSAFNLLTNRSIGLNCIQGFTAMTTMPRIEATDVGSVRGAVAVNSNRCRLHTSPLLVIVSRKVSSLFTQKLIHSFTIS